MKVVISKSKKAVSDKARVICTEIKRNGQPLAVDFDKEFEVNQAEYSILLKMFGEAKVTIVGEKATPKK